MAPCPSAAAAADSWVFNFTLRSIVPQVSSIGDLRKGRLNCCVRSIYLKKHPSKNTSITLRTMGFEDSVRENLC